MVNIGGSLSGCAVAHALSIQLKSTSAIVFSNSLTMNAMPIMCDREEKSSRGFRGV
jgi:hypothetical protein